MIIIKDKLIGFPEEVLDTLEEYRQKTGIPATDYIRYATVRRMITDGLIFFTTKYIEVEGENNLKYKKINAPPEAIKFCDGDKCEVSPLGKRC